MSELDFKIVTSSLVENQHFTISTVVNMLTVLSATLTNVLMKIGEDNEH